MTFRALLRFVFSVRLFSHALFWSWNVVFIVFVSAGLSPFILPELMRATRDGIVPWIFTVLTLALIAIPYLCTGAALLFLRKRPADLLRLLYGVQAPLMLVLAVRIFALQQLNGATAFLLSAFVAGEVVLAIEIFKPSTSPRLEAVVLRLAGATVLLATGMYVATLLSFYAVPIAVDLADSIFGAGWFDELWRTIVYRPLQGLTVFLVFSLFGLCTGSLFVTLPIAMPILSALTWRRAFRETCATAGATTAWAISGLAMVAVLGGFAWSNVQPQEKAFALLEKAPLTDAEREELLRSSPAIRDGLVNATLSSWRYLGTVENDSHIAGMWRSAFGMTSEQASVVQSLYASVAQPFLYRGGRADAKRADALYEEFFDVAMQDREQASIVDALSSSWNREQVDAGLLDRNSRKVELVRQEISVVGEHGDVADLELHEVYVNRTYENQEIYYLFTLPASATLTGLWLGDGTTRWPHVLATRGAAQQVYRNEVRRSVDPSLLEQVGPRQYRLRIFPILPRDRRAKSRPSGGAPMHLWMTWKTLAHDGAWPAPRLLEKRNVYWTRGATRTVRGQADARAFEGRWLPIAIEAEEAPVPAKHEIALAGGWRVSAEPLDSRSQPLPSGKRYAIVLDRSRSMERSEAEVASALAWMRQAVATSNAVDIYVTAAKSSGAKPWRVSLSAFDAAAVGPCFGNLRVLEMLEQLAELRGADVYDAILVLSDDVPAAEKPVVKFSDPGVERAPAAQQPIWLVHLGGRVPRGYDDWTIDHIVASGGGVSSSLEDVLHESALRERGWAAASGGYGWKVEKSSDAGFAASSESAFDALAARQVILTQARADGIGGVAQLDALHAIAKRHDIVTPWSSMIVLVNEWQLKALAEAEAKADRFDRETETGKDALPTNGNFIGDISSVPEPGEWALMAIGVAFLAWKMKRRRTLTAA